MVFHSPQPSQRPDQRECEAPQAEQVKVVVFAMAQFVPELARFFKPFRCSIRTDGPRRQAREGHPSRLMLPHLVSEWLFGGAGRGHGDDARCGRVAVVRRCLQLG